VKPKASGLAAMLTVKHMPTFAALLEVIEGNNAAELAKSAQFSFVHLHLFKCTVALLVLQKN
jgi:hypothetical protein